MAFQSQSLEPGQAANSFFAASQAVDALNMDLGRHFMRAVDKLGDSIIDGIDGVMNSAASKAIEKPETASNLGNVGVDLGSGSLSFGSISPPALPTTKTAEPEIEAPGIQGKLAGLNVAGLSMMSMSSGMLQPGSNVQSGVDVAVSRAPNMIAMA